MQTYVNIFNTCKLLTYLKLFRNSAYTSEVEDVMLKSVNDFHEKAMQDYSRKEREKWVTQWQGMGVLCIAMMFWTSQAEEAMKKGGIEGLRAFSDKLDRQVSRS